MQVHLFHDLSPQQLQAGFWKEIDGFFMGTYWYLRKPKVYDFVRDITLKGGLKKAFGIDDSVVYIHGSDRTIETSSKDKFRIFIRPPIVSLREAVCFNPDVIQVMDVPLDDADDENRICEKLAINRDIVMDYDQWLVKHGFRSSKRHKDGLPKSSKFMLLGVAHGDMPEVYAEEARFMMKKCEIIGVPVAGLLTRVKGLPMYQRYNYVMQVLEKVLEVVGKSRVIQCMGYGLSRISEVSRLLKLVKKYEAVLWLESSTIVRQSVHARKVLSVNLKNPNKVKYVNVARVKGAEKFTALDVFRENNKVLKGILNQTLVNG